MPKLQELPEPHMYAAYGLLWLDASHRFIRSLKKHYTPSVHGHKTWGSSFLLMDYLNHAPLNRNQQLLELGCGWAPAGIFCASRFQAKVLGVDMDADVFPFADVLATLNDVEISTRKARFEQLRRKDLDSIDVLIGSDICFWDSLVPVLDKLVRRAEKAGVTRVVLADPGRPTFLDLAERCLQRHQGEVSQWYAMEPTRVTGYILDISL